MCEAHGHNKTAIVITLQLPEESRRLSALLHYVDDVDETLTNSAVKSRDRRILLRNNSATMKLGGNNFHGLIS